jgi:Uncharacterised nucleotidyltransferase
MATTEAVRSMSLGWTVASHALAGAPEQPLVIGADEWPRLRDTLVAQRLTGLAVAALEAGHLVLSAERTADLLSRHHDAMVWALTIERKLLTLSEAFDKAGIETIVLKGPALAHAVYPDPSWRAYVDLDVLVRTRDWYRACALLESLGHQRRLPEPRARFDVRFGKAAVHKAGDGIEVDLHRTLVLGPFGLWMHPDELFGRTAQLPLGNRRLRRLDDTALLLHACMHASLGWKPPLLLPVRDVAQIAQGAQVDWDLLWDLASRWELRAVIRHALMTATSFLGARLSREALALMGRKSSRRERRALEAYISDHRNRETTAISTLRAIPGLRGKVAYVRAMLVPQRQFLEARSRDGGAPSYLRRWTTPVRWWIGRRQA